MFGSGSQGGSKPKKKKTLTAKTANNISNNKDLIRYLQYQLSELEQVLAYIESYAESGLKQLKIDNIEYPDNIKYLEKLGYKITYTDSRTHAILLSWEDA